MSYQIITTKDGSKTIFVPEINEQYHSLNGAIAESEYVFINKGYLFHHSRNPSIFEVGLGTGLNALLTAVKAEKCKKITTYYSIEKYPLDLKIITKLNYNQFIPETSSSIFQKLHSCEWDKLVQISEYFYLYKINSDLVNNPLKMIENCDLIYFDAFGPDKQPDMWTPDIFKKIFTISSPGCIFVTYSAKGEVRRQLSAAGFEMERLPGPPGKNEMLRGIKKISIL